MALLLDKTQTKINWMLDKSRLDVKQKLAGHQLNIK
jgi:hypothetical protein